MSAHGKGILALLGANLIWGFAPILYRALDHVGAAEILAHRTLWSFVFFALVIAMQGRIADLWHLAGRPDLRWRILLAAILISANWGLFIYAIVTGRALQAGLAYYIFPIFAVLMGVIVFKERLHTAQWGAVAVMVSAVAVFGLTIGAVPILPLILAVTFAVYGIVKRTLELGPVLSVTAETAVLAPAALLWILWLLATAEAPVFLANGMDSWLLILSGPLTGGPMVLFAYAARRLNYATLGLIQYMNPSLQTLVAVFVFAEPFSNGHAATLGLIWLALAAYSWAAFRRERLARRAADV